jgi:hypothetical protein
LLYLQGGVWNGQRLLSEEWVAEATRKQIETPNEPNPDWRQGYGFQFWMSRHGYRGDGAYGQFCLVLPEQDAVIATTAATENMQGILDAVWMHLLPAMSAKPAKTAATLQPSPVAEQLAARLAGLRLPAFEAKHAPESSMSAWADASFLPADGRCEAQPTLTGVELHHDHEHWQLTLVEGAVAFSAAVGTEGWHTNLLETHPRSTSVPLAVSGGWTDEIRSEPRSFSWKRRTGSSSAARWPQGHSRPIGELSRCGPGDCSSSECPADERTMQACNWCNSQNPREES